MQFTAPVSTVQRHCLSRRVNEDFISIHTTLQRSLNFQADLNVFKIFGFRSENKKIPLLSSRAPYVLFSLKKHKLHGLMALPKRPNFIFFKHSSPSA